VPKKMALELFKPFILRPSWEHVVWRTIKAAKKDVERNLPEVWDYPR